MTSLLLLTVLAMPLQEAVGPELVDQAGADKRLAGILAPRGMKVEIVAEKPPLNEAAYLTFDDEGTPVVAERRRTPPRIMPRSVALRAAKPGGPWDTVARTYWAGFPTPLLSLQGWLYHAGANDLRRGKLDRSSEPEVLLPFKGDSLAGPALGNDGWLYLASRGQLERARPDGKQREVIATGLQEPEGSLAFDLAGELFLTDGKRLLHAGDRADLSVKTHRPLATAKSPLSGVTIYNDSRLPETYRGLLLVNEPAGRIVRAYQPDAAGASIRVKGSFALLAGQGVEGFEPSHTSVGPDGALYVVTPARIYRLSWAGTDDQPALPLRPMDSLARLAKLDEAELLKSLSSEDDTVRGRARRELVARGAGCRPALLRLLNDEMVPLVARIQVLGALVNLYDASVQTALLRTLAEGDGELQRLAADALGRFAAKTDAAVNDALVKTLASEDRIVRRAAAVALGRLGAAGAADNLVANLSFDDGKDVQMREGLVRGLELLGEAGTRALLSLADSGVQKQTNRVVEVFIALRNPAAVKALPALLANRHVNDEQRADLIRALGEYPLDSSASLDDVANWVLAEKTIPAGVGKALLEVLALTALKKGEKCGSFVLAMLGEENKEIRLLAIHAAGSLRLDRARELLKRLASSARGDEKAAIEKALEQIDKGK